MWDWSRTQAQPEDGRDIISGGRERAHNDLRCACRSPRPDRHDFHARRAFSMQPQHSLCLQCLLCRGAHMRAWRVTCASARAAPPSRNRRLDGKGQCTPTSASSARCSRTRSRSRWCFPAPLMRWSTDPTFLAYYAAEFTTIDGANKSAGYRDYDGTNHAQQSPAHAQQMRTQATARTRAPRPLPQGLTLLCFRPYRMRFRL